MSEIPLRSLGNSGLAVSALGLGANNFGLRIDAAASRRVIDAALDAGINFIDTSDSYGDSEIILGDVLKSKRENVILATKFGSALSAADVPPDFGARGSRRYIRQAVERSLRRLQTDHIDLYQMHYPDPRTPIDETLGALNDLVHEGKVRYIGSSNFAAWQVVDAAWTAQVRNLERFVSAQNHYNLLETAVEHELLPALEKFDIGLLPYFPLASGVLTGKYRRGSDIPEDSRVAAWGLHAHLNDATFDVIEAIDAFANERSISVLTVALGWLAARNSVASVIAGATSVEQVNANVAAFGWIPSQSDLDELEQITRKGDPK